MRWLEGDAAALPLPDESADCALCQQGVQFFVDRDAAVREMRRVLAPGGRLALSVWRSIEANPGFAALAGALERHAGPEAGAMMRSPFAGPDREALRALVEDAGLRDVRVHIQIDSVRFPSAEELVRREAASSPLAGPLGALPAGVRDALVRDFAEAISVRADDDGVCFPMETQVVTGRR